jgi:hypothetical protein
MSLDPTLVDSSAASASASSSGASRSSAWRPSRLLVAEEWICVALLVAAGLTYLYAWMPRPAVPPAVAAAVARLKDPFSRDAGKVDAPVPLMRASQAMFMAIQQAEKLEHRGQFDDATRRAWKKAGDEVRRLGYTPVTSGRGGHVRLFMKEAELARMEDIAGVLEELLPGRFAALEAERDAAIEQDPSTADSLPAVSWMAVAESADDPLRAVAVSLASMHEQAAGNVRVIGRMRETVGYEYWRATCAAGASDTGLQARAALWRADFGYQQAAFERAKELYQTGFALWRQACGAVPELGSDPIAVHDLQEHEQHYREVLSVLGAAGADGGATDGVLDL